MRVALTVGQLIEELKKRDQSLPVVYSTEEGYVTVCDLDILEDVERWKFEDSANAVTRAIQLI